MINPGLNVKKSFRWKVGKGMFTTFGEITRPFIKDTLAKNNTIVFALVMFYEKISDKKSYIVLRCVIYNIIKTIYVLII